jgi:hypothetical protein
LVIDVSPAVWRRPRRRTRSPRECRRAPCVGAADTVRQGSGHRMSERRTQYVGVASTVRRAADIVRQGGRHRASEWRVAYVGLAGTMRRGGGHRPLERRAPCVRAAGTMRRSGGHRASGRRTSYVGAASTVRWGGANGARWAAGAVRRGGAREIPGLGLPAGGNEHPQVGSPL